MTTLFNLLESILGGLPFLISVNVIAFTLKAVILALFLSQKSQPNATKRSRFYLLLVLIGSMVEDSAWVVKLIQFLFVPTLDYRIQITWIRVAWAFSVIQYQALALFVESLAEQNHSLNLRQKIFVSISSIFTFLFFAIALMNINCKTPSDRPPFEFIVQQVYTLYALFPLMLPSLFFTIKKLHRVPMPSILKKQLTIIIQLLILPRLLSDFIQFYPFGFFPGYITSSYAVVGISTTLLTTIIFYCARRMTGLRFLNFKNHVQTRTKISFIDSFKDTLAQLSQATNVRELNHITQNFFKQIVHIPAGKVTLYFRSNNAPHANQAKNELSRIETAVETFLSSPLEVDQYLNQTHILIYDEIDFTNFYDETDLNKSLVSFLESINADIFIPIYKNETIIAYIIVDRHARLNQFYSNVERDEMVVFASYLGNIINLLQHRNLENLIHQEKELKEELYQKTPRDKSIQRKYQIIFKVYQA